MPYPVQAACREAAATKVDLPPEGSRERTQERADKGSDHAGLCPRLAAARVAASPSEET